MTFQFVNCYGTPLHICKVSQSQHFPAQKPKPDSCHKGWKVQGIPPDALEKARSRHLKQAHEAREAGREAKDFNEQDWLRNATRKPVRSKPYSIPDAAQTCAELATKAGWLQVEVVAIEKKPPST